MAVILHPTPDPHADMPKAIMQITHDYETGDDEWAVLQRCIHADYYVELVRHPTEAEAREALEWLLGQ